MDRIIIGSRGSQLALTQSRAVGAMLQAATPGLSVEIEIIHTKGDRILDAPLAQIGGKGLFTRELEVALLDGKIDLAVHSLKDLPTELPEGLAIGAIPKREHAGDALVSTKYDSLEALPSGATVGTSSLRRRAQLLAYRADLCVVDLRGNVDTRIRKVAEGELDAAILACAGLSRIGRNDAIRAIISTDIMLPAPAQGALGIEIRAGDPRVAEICSHIHDEAAHREATAERACLAALEGGCQIPIGAHAQIVDGQITLSACVCSVDGTTVLRVTEHASAEDPAIVGEQAAARLLLMGAAELIAALR